ncbi:uncharacterized protein LOC117322879 isoform X2 [Pecten maximus]|uniref:uncharacterized protein LOC117322879 isoform X2 n=1 Tax=Pecten maximus TaxID=6579 RepID=UPI001458F462|nr:uncharacterized protein LOC117322879 isoform X2 [Pecten maximus]
MVTFADLSIDTMLPSSRRLLQMNRLCVLVYRTLCDDVGNIPEYMKRWELKQSRCKLNKKTAESVKRCIEKNRRYKNSIVMESCGADEIFLHTKNKLDLAFLTQTTAKQHLYRKMNKTNQYMKKFPLPLKEYYQAATSIEGLGKVDSLLVVGIADRVSIRYLPVQVYQQTGMLSLGNVEVFLLMVADDAVKLMKKNGMQKYQVMLHTVFKIECLMKIPATAVTPNMKDILEFAENSLKMDKIEVLDECVSDNLRDYIYLMHFVINKDFNIDEDLFEFQAFVELLRRQEAYLIKKLESSFPGSGLPLLKAGYTMIHKVKHLSPDEFLDIFKMVRKVKTYKNLSKMKENIDLLSNKESPDQKSRSPDQMSRSNEYFLRT